MRRRLIVLVLAAAIVLAVALGLTAMAQAASFPDLGPSQLSGYSLQEIQVRAMSQGFADGLWRPSNNLTRAQFVKMAVENFDIAPANPATPTFMDVPSTDIYYQYIEGAVAAGLIKGVGDNLFASARTITRQEAVAVLVRWIAKVNNFDPAATAADDIAAALAPFDDRDTVSAGTQAEVAIALELGLLEGSGDDLLPHRALMRIEGAALLARVSFVLADVYQANLDSLNNSGVTGTALLFLRGDQLKVLVLATGLEANKEHMQHIHGLDDGSQGSCPPASADANHDGIISLAEGLPFYGPVLRPLDDPYPTAQADGMVFYSHRYSGTDLDSLKLGTVPLTNRVIVMHGMTVNGTYDATVPVACGVIEHFTGPQNAAGTFVVHPLVSDQTGKAPTVDANLVNGWGLVAGPTTPWWVADNGTDKSTLYDGTGAIRPLVVDVPASPTGTVFNATTSFVVTSGAATGAARFMFATEKGKILAWNPNVPAAGSTTALVVVDRSAGGAVYKGLAIGAVGTAPYIYATDFANGRIDVFAGDFTLQSWTGAFVDPTLPSGYGPFGIQAVGDSLFVTYAKQDPPSTDEKAGAGLGFVDEYKMNGDFVARVASQGALNAPWGLAMAPAAGFGKFSGCLLVGNFGDGYIHAYAKAADGSWSFKGTLRLADGSEVWVDGLWGIAFGMGNAVSGPATSLYFAAGPGDEAHGMFGFISRP